MAPDGSPVELYLRLPSFGEAEIIHAAVPAGASILELGCGVGRMTHELIRLGHPVTAVDESAEMLAHVRGATTVEGRIEELDLGRRFGCVLLASHFVNAADPAQRRRLLEVCARHVAADGRVVIETYPDGWRPRAGDVTGREGLEVRYLQADWTGASVTATIEYRVGEDRWTQGPFTAAVLDEPALVSALHTAGLAFDDWLDDRRTWLAARTEAPRTEGDSALLVSIGEAEPVIGALRRAHDPVATEGVPAHVTVLYPFVPRDELTNDVRAAVSELFGAIPAFAYRFDRVKRFGSTTVYLEPEPADGFSRLTEAAHALWPQHPPYGGMFDAVIPHLTVADGLEDSAADALADAARTALTRYGPIVGRAAEVTLITWDPARRWSVDSRYPLAEQG